MSTEVSEEDENNLAILMLVIFGDMTWEEATKHYEENKGKSE